MDLSSTKNHKKKKFPSPTEINSHKIIIYKSKIKATELKIKSKSSPAKTNKKINKNKISLSLNKNKNNKTIKRCRSNKMSFCLTQKNSSLNINKKIQKLKQELRKLMELLKRKFHIWKMYNLMNKIHKKYT